MPFTLNVIIYIWLGLNMPSYYLFSYLSHFFIVLVFLPLVQTGSRYHNPPYLLYTPEADATVYVLSSLHT